MLLPPISLLQEKITTLAVNQKNYCNSALGPLSVNRNYSNNILSNLRTVRIAVDKMYSNYKKE